MAQLGLQAYFEHQVIQLYGDTATIKNPSGMLGKTYPKSLDMRQLAMKTVEPVYTSESTDSMVIIIDSNYVNADLEQVADNVTHINDEERNQQLGLLKYLEDWISGNLGYWDT